MKSRTFYVYEHWRPDKDECFYVGKGHGRRANDMRERDGRNQHHLNIQAKLARLGMCVEVRMVRDDLAEPEAFVLERERISFWRSAGVSLTNQTDGGEGSSGWIATAETRAKMSASKKGRPGPKHSPETKAKMSATAKRRGAILVLQQPEIVEKTRSSSALRALDPEEKAARRETRRLAKLKGRQNSDETRAKKSAAHKGKVLSEHHRANISASKRGRPRPDHVRAILNKAGTKQSPETIAKRVAKTKGQKRSEEFRKSASERARLMWERKRQGLIA